MARIVPALLALLTLAAAAPAERRYTVTDFDRVRIDGTFAVEIVTGKPSAASALVADAATLDNVLIDVDGKTLRLRMKPATLGAERRPGGLVTVRLSTRDLRALSVTGASMVTLDGAQAQKLDLYLSGSGAIDARGIETDLLNLGLLGSGRIVLAGEAKTLKATVQGSGDVDGHALAVDQAQIHAESAGEIAFDVRTVATIQALGTGGTTITGSAACDVNGPGTVTCARD